MLKAGRRFLSCMVVAVSAGLGAASTAEAALINGSFEQGPPIPGNPQNWTFYTVTPGSTGLTGWEVTGGGVDWVYQLWEASDGQYSVELNSTSPGGIQQTLLTEVGQTYRVEFDFGGNPEGEPNLKEMDVRINGASVATFTFDVQASGSTPGDIAWVGRSFEFTATGTETTLGFHSLNAGAFGPALDNVRVTLVPEPANAALLLTGLGWLATRRRRHA